MTNEPIGNTGKMVPLTIEQLRKVPHGKISDSTLKSICDRANEIARGAAEDALQKGAD